MEGTISSTASARPGLHSVIVAATIGNVLEWFDFLVYGFFAVTIAAAASVFSIMATARNRDADVRLGTARASVWRAYLWPRVAEAFNCRRRAARARPRMVRATRGA